VTGRELLDELEAQEARLVFDHFDDDVAWSLGVALRDAATAAGLPVAISIRRNGQRLFHAALAGSSADNDAWLARNPVCSGVRASSAAWKKISRVIERLEAYNSGRLCAPSRDCGER